jgi:hypothetical protein
MEADMLTDKRADLVAEKRRRLLERLVAELSRSGLDLYYSATSEVAATLLSYAKNDAKLNADEHALIDGLSQRDVEVLLSLKH